MKLFLVTLLLPILALGHSSKTIGMCDFPGGGKIMQAENLSGISRATFNSAIDEVEDLYSPIFEKMGCPLIVLRSWQNDEINAQAWQMAGFCFVEIFGGLARYPNMGKRTLQIVICHELGHHIGGRPFYTGTNLSVEGQSDYFATYQCMTKLGVDTSISSLNLSRILAELNGDIMPSRQTRAQERPPRTLQSHPRAQCRLDTYDAGRQAEPRPRCWYAGGAWVW